MPCQSSLMCHTSFSFCVKYILPRLLTACIQIPRKVSVANNVLCCDFIRKWMINCLTSVSWQSRPNGSLQVLASKEELLSYSTMYHGVLFDQIIKRWGRTKLGYIAFKISQWTGMLHYKISHFYKFKILISSQLSYTVYMQLLPLPSHPNSLNGTAQVKDMAMRQETDGANRQTPH